MSASGGVPTPVTTVAKDGLFGHLYPTFLPDGEHFLFAHGYLGSLRGGDPVRILSERHNSLYAPPAVAGESGYLLFRRDETLMAQRFDPVSHKLSGDAVSVATQVPRGGSLSYGLFSVSGTGTLVYTTETNAERQLAWIDRSGKRLSVAGKPGRYRTSALSPDDKGIAVTIGKPNGGSEIWVRDLSRDVLSRLTFRDGEAVFPVWSADGKSLVFGFRGFSASTDLYRKPLGSNNSEELLVHGGTNGAPREISQDGKWLLYGNLSPTTGRDLWLLPLQGDRKPVPFLQSRFNEYFGSFSPDAKWIAYESDESGRAEIYVQAVPAGGAKYQISTDGGTVPVWRRDGKEIYYRSPEGKLMAAPVRIGTTIEAGTPQSLFALRGAQGFTPSGDGQRFLVVEAAGGEEAATVPPVTVVLNWQAELKK